MISVKKSQVSLTYTLGLFLSGCVYPAVSNILLQFIQIFQMNVFSHTKKTSVFTKKETMTVNITGL